MDLYHIHRVNEHGHYHEGQILYPGTEFNSLHEGALNNIPASIPVAIKSIDGCDTSFWIRFDEYAKKKLNRNNVTPDELKTILMFTRAYIKNNAMNNREIILEEIRREFYSTLPSRYRCMWLADEDSLEYWSKTLIRNESEYEIFKVSADGNLFVSTNTLLPNEYKRNNVIYEQAHKYWNPDSECLKNAKDREYLFEGELKILKKIK